MVKNLPAIWDTWVWSLGWDDPLEKEMATHSSILAWRIPWTDESCGLQSMGSKRVGHDWVTKHSPIVSVPSSWLHLNKYLVPKAPPPNTILMGTRASTYEWGGGTQTLNVYILFLPFFSSLTYVLKVGEEIKYHSWNGPRSQGRTCHT